MTPEEIIELLKQSNKDLRKHIDTLKSQAITDETNYANSFNIIKLILEANLDKETFDKVCELVDENID